MIIHSRNGVSLKRLTTDNAYDLVRLANDPDIGVFLRDVFPYPYTYTHAIEYIQLASGNNLLLSWGIFEYNELAGVISLVLQEDIYRHSAEIGYWLGKDFRGKGIMTTAVELICNYAFSELNIIRLFAPVFETNKASEKVLLKNGFILEGIRKKAVIKNKILLDDYLMAKLKY